LSYKAKHYNIRRTYSGCNNILYDYRYGKPYDIFIDRLQKYIGQYLAVLNGADAIIFTAGIGENAVNVRSSIINGISWFGCKVDPEKNVFGVVGDISTDDSRVKVLVIPTDEELVIARDVERFKNQ